MPALAVTEHGNLFSAIVVLRPGAAAGHQADPGCEVYVAPGSRLDQERAARRDGEPPVLLAETNEGFHNLIKLVSSAYTEGFYYKPRIDKDLLAQHSQGLIGLSSCLKGEVAERAARRPVRARPPKAAATYRDILGAGNFFLELQYQGIEEQRIVNNGLLPLARDLGMPLVCTNDVHYLRRDDYRPHDVLLCIGTGKTVNDAERHALPRRPVLPEDARGDGGGLRRTCPRRCATRWRIAERCDVDLSDSGPYLPNFQVPDGFTLDGYFEHVVREGFEMRLARLQELRAAGRAAPLDRGLPRAPAVRDRRHQADAVPGLLPDRRGTSSATRASRASRWARAAARRRAASWPTACASPTSIRCSSTCSSSAS